MLESLQTDFMAALRGAHPAVELGRSAISPEHTWQIYRRNYLQSHVAALVDTYSTVRSIVGERYLRHIAKGYVDQADSMDGDLNEYGADFPAYLIDVGERQDLPYLADVAQLDWHWLQQLRAPLHQQDWLNRLLSLDPLDWPSVRAVSGAVVVASRFPIFSIWKAATQGGDSVDLDAGAQTVLVTRPDHVEVALLEPAEEAFAVRWLDGCTLEASLEQALRIDEGFEIGPMLMRMATIGAVQSIESKL